jgi:hypothetical protein
MAFAFNAIGTAVKFAASGEGGNMTMHDELEAAISKTGAIAIWSDCSVQQVFWVTTCTT